MIGLVCSIKTYGKFSMGLNVLEGVLQGWDIDCFRAVPVEEAVFGWEFFFCLVEVILVQYERIWQDISKEPGQGCLST